MFALESMTPLGLPVEPLVKIIVTMSSGEAFFNLSFDSNMEAGVK